MDQELFIRISKEFNALERKLAVVKVFSSKTNPVVLIAYFLLLAIDGMMYFRAFFINGRPRSIWLSAGIVILIPIVLSLLRKGLRARLYPKAEAACTVTVPEWAPDRFADMDAILEEKSRLNRKYTTMVPALPFLLSAPLLVLCYHYTASLPGMSVPEGAVLHLVLMCIFYAVYGCVVVVCNCENAILPLSTEVDAAVKEYRKTKSDRSKAERRGVKAEQEAAQAERRRAENERRLNDMVCKACRHNPPDFKLLYKAAAQGSEDAVARAGRALGPLIMEKYPKCWELKADDDIQRERYRAMVDAFEEYAIPLAEAGNEEVEFALIAVRCFIGRPVFWEDLKAHTIPRVKALMTNDAVVRHWGDIPKRVLADMEHTVEVYESRPLVFHDTSGALASSSDDALDDIQKSLAAIGLCAPLPDVTTDV